MRTVVCFGDSNTWGLCPKTFERYPWHVRWPGRLQEHLGVEYRVVEEGLNGRTTSWDDPLWFGRNGRAYLPIVVETHSPIDVLTIMLGTNDLKARFGLSAFSIAQGLAELLDFARNAKPAIPHILVIAPPHVVPTNSHENSLAFAGAIEKSRELATHYRYFSEKFGGEFLDGASVASSSSIDGIHLDEEANKALATAVAEKIHRFGN